MCGCYDIMKTVSWNSYLFIIVCMYGGLGAPWCSEIKGQLYGFSSLLPSLCGCLGLNSGHQACVQVLCLLSHLTGPRIIFKIVFDPKTFQ